MPLRLKFLYTFLWVLFFRFTQVLDAIYRGMYGDIFGAYPMEPALLFFGAVLISIICVYKNNKQSAQNLFLALALMNFLVLGRYPLFRPKYTFEQAKQIVSSDPLVAGKRVLDVYANYGDDHPTITEGYGGYFFYIALDESPECDMLFFDARTGEISVLIPDE